MIQKILLFLLLLLLQSCSFTTLFMQEEVNQVTVVNYTSYKKHHRAYFTRDTLKPIKNGKKYLYLYRKKSNDLAMLLHRKNQYLLYSMSQPNQAPYKMKVTKKTTLTQVLKGFKKHGYLTISSLANRGYVSTVSYKKYKGLKTLLVETKKYSHLQTLYRKAIKSYDASKVRYIRTKLPKQLIRNYYQFYLKRATTREQLLQLRTIAKNLDLNAPTIPSLKPKKKHIDTPKSKRIIKNHIHTPKVQEKPQMSEPEIIEEDKEVTPIHKPSISLKLIPKHTIIKNYKPFSYYLNSASLSELSYYMSNRATKNALSYTQYTKLNHRKTILEEEKLMKQGSLEELISAYKINKKPKYKQRIMSLMKDKQTQ